MGFQKMIYLLLLIIIFPNINAAIISGSIYDFNLDLNKDVIVEINSTPQQRIISKDASYQFEVANGIYLIKASQFEEKELISTAEEIIEIIDNGNYIVDLFTFPDFSDVEGILEEDVSFGDIEYEEKTNDYWLYVVVVLMIICIILYYLYKQKSIQFKSDDDGDIGLLIKILKQNHGRITQKELRSKMPLSEAKISLLVTELKHKGLVAKIKKGRSNILLLKK